MPPHSKTLAHKDLRLSVVICAYTEDRWQAMLAAVESIRQQTLPASEILLVIDHNPALLARARSALKDVTILENQQAPGLSGARNSGILSASGDVIVFMDEDAAAEKQWLEKLTGPFQEPRVLGVGGAILPQWDQGQPVWFPPEFHWVVGCTYRGMPQVQAPVRNLIGCNMAFRREVFDQVGLFRHGIGRVGTFPAGCEETEICIRASQHIPQGIFLFEPDARVHHLVPAWRGSLHYFKQRCFAEGRSKALVTGLVGAKDGLTSERSYVLHTLPGAVIQGLRDTLRHGSPAGIQRAALILTGLAVTACGYLSGKAALWNARQKPASRFPGKAGAEISNTPLGREQLG
jgi:glucosyl-dolichyl phosphate glucuronosyltransferase